MQKGETMTEIQKRKIGESNRFTRKPDRKGNKNPSWNGGRFYDQHGYVFMYRPDHECVKNKKRKYVFEHRLVMEAHIGRCLESWELVHHKNGKKDDNRLSNLAIVVRNNHYGEVRCPHCKNNFLIK